MDSQLLYIEKSFATFLEVAFILLVRDSILNYIILFFLDELFDVIKGIRVSKTVFIKEFLLILICLEVRINLYNEAFL